MTTAALSQTIRIATIGDIDQNVAKFSLSDRQIPIRVSLSEESRRTLSTIENLPVPTANGKSVPLKVVADIGFGAGAVIALRIGMGVADVIMRVHAVREPAVGGADDLRRRTDDDRIGRDDRAVLHIGVLADDAVIADHCAVVDGGVDADQHVVTDRAAVQRRVMGDRAIVADDHRLARIGVDHHEVLDVGAAADFDVRDLRPDDGIAPDRAFGVHLDAPVDLRAGVDIGGFAEVENFAHLVFPLMVMPFLAFAERRNSISASKPFFWI